MELPWSGQRDYRVAEVDGAALGLGCCGLHENKREQERGKSVRDRNREGSPGHLTSHISEVQQRLFCIVQGRGRRQGIALRSQVAGRSPLPKQSLDEAPKFEMATRRAGGFRGPSRGQGASACV